MIKTVKEYSSLNELTKCYNTGWFFIVYQLTSSKVPESGSVYNCSKVQVASTVSYSSRQENPNLTVTATPSSKTKTINTVRLKHFMNSMLDTPGTYSCAVDCFLELSSYLFLPFIKQLSQRSEFLDLLFQTVNTYVEFRECKKHLATMPQYLKATLK